MLIKRNDSDLPSFGSTLQLPSETGMLVRNEKVVTDLADPGNQLVTMASCSLPGGMISGRILNVLDLNPSRRSIKIDFSMLIITKEELR